MIDRNKLIEVIKEYEIDYDVNIPMERISSIMWNYWDLWFYLEELRGDAWNSDEAYCYLSYYDVNAKAGILIEDVGWDTYKYDINSNEDLADLIIKWEELVESYRKQFLYLKKK